jgi:hypothetical protein
MNSERILTVVIALLLMFVSCARTSVPEPSPGKVTGVVFNDANRNGTFDKGRDKPLKGVAVSNGREVAITNRRGIYELPLVENSAVFVIKPRDYIFPLDDRNTPVFYRMNMPFGASGTRYSGLDSTEPLASPVNFPLYRSREPDNIDVLVFGDTQPRNDREIHYIQQDIVAELIGTTATFGVVLGDIVYDNLNLYEHMTGTIAAIDIPWIYVPGNHDHDYTGDNNTDALGSWYRNFGPDYYSFTCGPAHFIVLNTIRWIVDEAGRRYRTGLGSNQLEFVRNEVARIPDDQLLVLLTHIPYAGSTGWADPAEREEFYRILADHPRSATLAAHTHRHYHHLLDEEEGFPGDIPHHMVSIGAICGSWWSGAPDEFGIPHSTMADGTPTCYSRLHITGSEWKLSWQGARRPAEFQMHIDAPQAITEGSDEPLRVTANIYNALPSAEVKMRIGEGEWIEMSRTVRKDSVRVAVTERERELGTVPWRKLDEPYQSEHLWEAVTNAGTLDTGVHTIEIVARDSW